MNVSDNEKALTDAYYWLSMYKSGATTEDVAMEKVKEVIFNQPQLLGASRVVQYAKGNVKVQVSEKLNEDLAMHITFLAMNVEALANKLRVSTETVLELVKENIETELMMFNLEQEVAE